MADFCHGCLIEMGAAEYADRNDFRWTTGPGWGLCEGCGWHVFLPGGHRCHPRLELVNIEGCGACHHWTARNWLEIQAGWFTACLFSPPDWADPLGTQGYATMLDLPRADRAWF